MTNTNRPNILMICTDQQRFDSLGCTGAVGAHTPNIDRLAETGARFSNCYVQNPICSPSRASLFTGMYTRNHGLWANGVSLPPYRKMFTRALADGGYDCGMIGKQHLSACEGWQTEARLDDGYRVFEWSHDAIHRSPQNAYLNWLAEHHPGVLAGIFPDEGHPSNAGAGNQAKDPTPMNTVPVEAHFSHWVAERSIDFIETQRNPAEPFFLLANFFDPHHPFGAPEEFRAKIDASKIPPPKRREGELAEKPARQTAYSEKSYAGAAPGFVDYTDEEIIELRANYYAMIALVDHEVGRILDALEAAGQTENMLIVFTSDHGEMLGDHSQLLKGPMLYDACTRVPLILNWPGVIDGGTVHDALVQWIDLSATYLDAAQCPPLPAGQGRSLLPFAKGEPVADWRDFALCEYRDSGHPGVEPVNTTMLRRDAWKLIVWHGDGSGARPMDGELYNLDDDPDEFENLFHRPEHIATRRRMKAELLDVIAATDDLSAERLGCD
ncbi:MAG: hypothetical protein CL812_00810 [Confluentimicrobium sp.]|nr:hypothetical protein [Actibacterium sp.]